MTENFLYQRIIKIGKTFALYRVMKCAIYHVFYRVEFITAQTKLLNKIVILFKIAKFLKHYII